MKKSSKIKLWAYCMRLGNKFGCHQREDRSFKIGQWQFPICSRCTGILTGQIICIILYLCTIRVPFYLSAVFLFIMFLDWYLQYKDIKESTNFRRFITGNLAGIAQISILLNICIWILTRLGGIIG